MGRIQWAGVAFAAQLWVVAAATALAQAPTLDPQVGVTTGAPTSVELTVRLTAATYRRGERPAFDLVLANRGPGSVLLNGGAMLGNGQQDWSAFTCTLRNASGDTHQLSLHWGVMMVGGRLYFLGVPLLSGASISIPVAPGHYFVNGLTALPADRYELTCRYFGTQSSLRDPTQLPPCWEGQATSTPVRFEVIDP